jgi:predicted nuclease with RNAse H fold
MSPMFLGGLTARAMKIKASLTKQGLHVYETFPSALAKYLKLETGKCLSQALNMKVPRIKDQHEFDSILCLLSAKRYLRGVALAFGDNREGVIII